jgi:predicted dehydrogenase
MPMHEFDGLFSTEESHMTQPLRLCMIGAGNHASKNIYPYLHQLKNAVVVANADLDQARAQRVAGRFGIAATHTDYRQMLDLHRPDGVVVCVNSSFHAQISLELLNLGYHVYLEKPSCNTLADARAMLQASRRQNRICMTAYKKRFAPAYQKAKAIIAGDSFGKPTLLSLLRTRGPFKPSDNPIDAYLLQWGCHVVDLVCYLFGEVTEVAAMKTGPSPHAYAVTFRFANEAIGNFAVTDRIKGRNWEQVSLIGSEGVSIQIDNSTEMIAARDNQPFAAHKPDWVSGSSLGSVEQGYFGELQAFVDAIANNTQPEANMEQSAHTMAVYEAIQRSATCRGDRTEVEAV